MDEFGIVFWCDASARFQRSPLVLVKLLKELHGFLSFYDEFKADLMLARTHPKMFEALGIDREKFSRDVGYAMCMGAGRLMFANTDLIRTNIIEPWVDCALKSACIAPEGSVLPTFVNGTKEHTHRFDQAALALIVYKNLRGMFNESNDWSRLLKAVVGIYRSSKGYKTARFCKS